MSITHAEHMKLKQFMADDVEQFITDAMQDWAIAAEGAVADAHYPEDDDSGIYWWVSLAGNLLWASTVFFPVAGEVAAAARWALAEKVASVTGGTLGADTLRKMLQDSPATDEAKEFLRDMIATKEDELRNLFVKQADVWIASDLANYVTQEMLAAAHVTPDSGKSLVDENAEDLMKSVREKANLRDYALQHFLFPGGSITSGNLSTALRKLMLVEINRALADFNQQFRSWKKDRAKYVQGQLSGNWGKHRPPREGHKPWENEYERLEGEYAEKNPFQPNLRFHGVPPHLHGPHYLSMPVRR